MAELHDDTKSVTRCICEFTHDDEYMINCDNCFVWQHCACMGLNKSNLPEKYFCEVCSPRRVNYKLAREIQSKFFASPKKELKKPKKRNGKSIIKKHSTKPAKQMSKQLNNKKSLKATSSKVVENHYHIKVMPVSKKKEKNAKSLFITKNSELLKLDHFIKDDTKCESSNKNEDSSDVAKISKSEVQSPKM